MFGNTRWSLWASFVYEASLMETFYCSWVGLNLLGLMPSAVRPAAYGMPVIEKLANLLLLPKLEFLESSCSRLSLSVFMLPGLIDSWLPSLIFLLLVLDFYKCSLYAKAKFSIEFLNWCSFFSSLTFSYSSLFISLTANITSISLGTV